ncbi:MAG TPA: N(4)-(beta-N-acetylglucosaminyl)-L-asparaginase [Blastocatellia bacterium]|nr:N(4)-(beta-N-acetylglucosaminyl)-L-asparaginase [Blastocatellia bacterium]
MKSKLTRRDFVRTTTTAGIAAGLITDSRLTFAQSKPSRPLVVSSANGLRATEKAMEMIRAGKDTLDAVIAGVNIVEDDPKDMSVGYGGLPNEEGVVELDASVMHGPTKRAGAVASIRYIKNPSKVAKLVMERTDHLLLVGEGALRFALAHGFEKQELLTPESRAIWLRWKETMSDRDAWGPGLASPDTPSQSILDYKGDMDPRELLALADEIIAHPITGTINCIAVNERGDISGTTTTSGLSFKIPGRVGDSPLIGCGLFVDNEVGAAGSTGRGEECIKINGAHTVVEMMRRGMSPTDACMEAVKRVANNYNNNLDKLRKVSINFYALNKNGEYGGATLWGYSTNTRGERRRGQYAVHDGRENKLHDLAYLYESPDKK